MRSFHFDRNYDWDPPGGECALRRAAWIDLPPRRVKPIPAFNQSGGGRELRPMKAKARLCDRLALLLHFARSGFNASHRLCNQHELEIEPQENPNRK